MSWHVFCFNFDQLCEGGLLLRIKQKHKEKVMRKLVSAFGVFCMASFLAGSVMAEGQPSAKFAATWTDTPFVADVAEVDSATAVLNQDGVAEVSVDMEGFTMATIKVPQNKQLLVGVSAEIGIVTYNLIKGKNGGNATSLAEAGAYVDLFAVPASGGAPIALAPGSITLSSRSQELSATLGGVIEECTFSCDTVCTEALDCTTNCNIDISEDCTVSDEEIGLLLDTTAAHHFNFVLPETNAGVYDIKAIFTIGEHAKIDLCVAGEDCYMDGATVSASAEASAVINKTMVTVQEVRAAKGGVIDAGTISPSN
jgi:hypothetical protein